MIHPERIEPGPGQESVWDYPRPPALDPTDSLVLVVFGGVTVAETRQAVRILETSQAPAFYIPAGDVVWEHLRPAGRRSFCEWKGEADYLDLVVGHRVSPEAAWRYRAPTPRYGAIAGHLAFYPSRVDACFVDGERVRANEGDFYGGWITSRVVGPFKGGAGSSGW
ncbi:MAG: DUF427 domain-containing protein [Acidimicrobiales bacterium]|jgi:uncharacterized protein (DUF427 family)|nr:DUF427 domain-containing protein [Acidimicrobiales bacterium]